MCKTISFPKPKFLMCHSYKDVNNFITPRNLKLIHICLDIYKLFGYISLVGIGIIEVLRHV